MITKRTSAFIAFEIAVVVVVLAVHGYSTKVQVYAVFNSTAGNGGGIQAGLFLGKIELAMKFGTLKGSVPYVEKTELPNLPGPERSWTRRTLDKLVSFFRLPSASISPDLTRLTLPLWTLILLGWVVGWLIFRRSKSARAPVTAEAEESEQRI